VAAGVVVALSVSVAVAAVVVAGASSALTSAVGVASVVSTVGVSVEQATRAKRTLNIFISPNYYADCTAVSTTVLSLSAEPQATRSINSALIIFFFSNYEIY
jgi:predicted HD phosphohydrolase